MTAAEEVKRIYDLAKGVLDEREPVYQDSWKKFGLDTCFENIPRKAEYLKVQKRNGKMDSPKFGEDLLDLMNWCAFTYMHWEGGRK